MPTDISTRLTINKPSRPSRVEAVPPDQIAALLAEAPSHPDIYPAVLCMYYLGLRYGEAAGLTWADLDFDAMTAHIHQQRSGFDNTIRTTKTAAGNREIPMPDDFVAIMRPMRQMPSAFVCPLKSRSAFNTAWLRLLLDAGLASYKDPNKRITNATYIHQAFTPHQLRHTYVTILYDAGIDPLTASRIVGHSSYSVTADIYTTITNQRKQQSSDAIRAAFSNSCTIVAHPAAEST